MHTLHSNIANTWSMPRHKACGHFAYAGSKQQGLNIPASLAPSRDVSMPMK